jgi:NAD(P)-dependent dehydrogenase (short-subunit alcohol dehydrogenase family)
MPEKKITIIGGPEPVLGAGLAEGFLTEGYKVVAASLSATQSLSSAPHQILIDGDIANQRTAVKSVHAATHDVETINLLVNDIGICRAKTFTEFTVEGLNAPVSSNLMGFPHITQIAVSQMLKEKSKNEVTITGTLGDNPIAGMNASVSMVTKGGLNMATRRLAIEHAKDGIRLNAIAPGVEGGQLHKDDPKVHLKTLRPMSKMASVKDVVDAV